MRSNVMSVAVIGGGAVGAGIALDFALGGRKVVVYTRSPQRRREVLDRIARAGMQLVEFGVAASTDVTAALERVSTSSAFAESVSSVDYVVEAVPEDVLVKRRVLAEVDAHAGPDVVIASTTTAISVVELARDCVHRGRVIAARYTMPAHLIPVVDVAMGDETAPEAADVVRKVLIELGKQPVMLRRDAPGGIGPRLLTAMMNEALRLVDEGVADPVSIDRAVMGGIGRRLGAVGIFDRIDTAGVDTVVSVFERQRRPVPRVLEEKVHEGALGRKSGQGFYPWSPTAVEEFDRREARHLAGHLLRDRRAVGAGAPSSAGVWVEPGVLDEFLASARTEYINATPEQPPRCFAVLIGAVDDGAAKVTGVRFARTVRDKNPNVAEVWQEAVVPCFGAAYANARRGYWVDPADLLRINREAENRGEDVIGSIHLHPDWHRTGPAHERGLRISERPTPMDRFLIANTGWPLNMICYVERTPYGLGQTIAAWGPPPSDDPAGDCVRITIQYAMS